ncbi:MAG: ATP synthase F1 subunit epsilon [Holophagales bacterium]|nr:ATP synthase F1 subunit epsilon [Holophagales bacterium]
MAGTFHVSVVTPEREVLAADARFVALPSYDGEMGILARRAPLLTQLGHGLLRIELADGSRRALFISGGFAQMVEDRLTLLTEEAIESETITMEAVRESLAAAGALPGSTLTEQGKKMQALDRARALGRAAR